MFEHSTPPPGPPTRTGIGSHSAHRAGVPLPPPVSSTERRSRLGRPLLVVAALLAGAVGGSVAGNAGSESATPAPTPVAGELTAATPRPVQPGTATGRLDLSDLIAETTASVVRIDAMTPIGPATGTGFVIDAEGTVVTNAHVVGNAATVEVRFADGNVETARVLGRAVTEDLAVIDVDAAGLPFLELGSSTDLRVGQPVVAIGNALGLAGSSTATDGIVSALDRTIDIGGSLRLEHLIQTDAAINPGNSGGPLLDLDGRVVGINSAGSPGAQSIGFAIAIDEASETIASLRDGVPVTRPYLGVTTTVVTAQIARQIGTDVENGVVITDVAIGSAAEAAGLRAGDVVTAVDGDPVLDGSVLADAVESGRDGEALALTVERFDERLTMKVVPGRRLA